MYCIYCGGKIKKEDNYCEHCGKKVKKEIFSLSTHVKIFLGGIFIVLLLSIGIGKIIQIANSPEYQVIRFVKSFEQENAKKIFRDLGLSNSEFMNEKTFFQTFENENIVHIQKLKQVSCETKDNISDCNILYETKEKKELQETIYLTKKDQKWTIENTKFKTVKNWKLYLPNNASAKLNNVDLAPYKQETCDKDGFDCYQVEEIFKGNYILNMNWNEMDLETNVKINETNTYTLNTKDLTENRKQEILKMIQSITEKLYRGVIEKKSKEDLNLQDPLTKTYEKLQKEIKQDLNDFQIQQLDFMDITLDQNGLFQVQVKMNYTYQITKNDQNHSGKSSDIFTATISKDMKEVQSMSSLVTFFSTKY